MIQKKYELHIDIYKGILNPQSINFVTDDCGNCKIVFKLFEDKITKYDLSNCKVRMVIAGQQQDCTITDASNGTCEIVLLQSMFSQSGNYRAELQIYDSTNQVLRLTTPTFLYSVRGSLMNDSTVAADPNYSILQDMIINVTNADTVANEALTTANSAKVTAGQAVTTINAEVTKVNKAVTDANTALDRATSVATQEELNNKLTLNGEKSKQNFNFIENKVVQDGLVYSEFNKSYKENTFTEIKDTAKVVNGSYTIFFKSDFVKKPDGTNSILFGSTHTEGIYSNYSNTLNSNVYHQGKLNNNVFKPLSNVLFVKDSEYLKIYVDNELVKTYVVDNSIIETKNIFINRGADVYNFAIQELKHFVLYNRALTPQEIQHNFSVLNNSPSINQLQVTNSPNQTSILSFGANANHVEMSSGRTLEEEYMGVLEGMSQEYTSTGASITVNDGLKARLVGMSIRDIEVMDIDKMEDFVKANKVDIAILTMPKSRVKETAEQLASWGVKGLWNFSAVDLFLPNDVHVENVHLSHSLMTLAYKINEDESVDL